MIVNNNRKEVVSDCRTFFSLPVLLRSFLLSHGYGYTALQLQWIFSSLVVGTYIATNIREVVWLQFTFFHNSKSMHL